VHNPPVIILDEPTVGLDPIQIKEIRSLIKELGNDHAVILSTHILPEVQESCSHVQIIHQGQIILYETVAGLNLQANTATLKLMTRAAIDKSRLMVIAGVIQVEIVAATEYLIRHSQEANPIEAITETVISAGWGLIEITPLKRSMEDIFIALTQSNDESK
jgi:ABC-2 type transport system ATP-binding protein